METRENPTKNEREEERKQLFQDYLQIKDEFSERLSNQQKVCVEAKKLEKSKTNVLIKGEGNLTLVKLIFLQRLQEKQNCIQPINNFRIIKIIMHQPHFFEKKQNNEQINPEISEKIHFMKGNIKEVKNVVFSGNMVFKKIQNVPHGEAKTETKKGNKNEEFVKQFSRNSHKKQDSNEKDNIESNLKPKNALTDKIAIFNNMNQKNTTEKNNNNAPKIQKPLRKVQSLKEKYEKAVNDTNAAKTIEKPKINYNLNTESIRNGDNRFSLETITEKNGESCSQIFDGDMAASRKTYGGKLSISQHVIKEEDDDIIKNQNYGVSNENNPIRKEDDTILYQNMGKNEETKNVSLFLKNEIKEKQENSTRNDSKEGELLKEQTFSKQTKINQNTSTENKEKLKIQQNLIPTPSEPNPFKNKKDDGNKTWIKKSIEKEETNIQEKKQKEEEKNKKEENEKEKDNELPKGKKEIMEKLMKLSKN